MTEENIGVYSILIKASEVQFGQKYEYMRKFYLQVKPKIVEIDETNTDITETFDDVTV